VTRHLSTALLLLGLAAPATVRAMCVDPGPPRLLDAEVVACRDPRAVAAEKPRPGGGQGGHSMQAGAAGESVDGFLAARPAQVVTLRVTRTRQLRQDPRTQDDVEKGPWTAVAKPKDEQYLLFDTKDCAELEPGRRVEVVADFVCCDVLPTQDLACLLQLPALVPAGAPLRGER
jgi:hypothetical protein